MAKDNRAMVSEEYHKTQFQVDDKQPDKHDAVPLFAVPVSYKPLP